MSTRCATVATCSVPGRARRPRCGLLVTARTPLGVAGERIVRVGGLAVPPTDDVAAVLTSPAGQLFLALVRKVRPGYDLVPSDPATARDAGHVASICRRLDGLPLGLEIVAARSKIRSMVELAAEMSDLASIRRPDTAAPERHLSVAAAVDWSYQLLDEDSAGALRCLSLVESAGNDLVALMLGRSTAARGEILTDLVKRSLAVDATAAGDRAPRLRLLETVRAVADGHIGAEERARLHQRLDQWCSELGGTGTSSGLCAVRRRGDVLLPGVPAAAGCPWPTPGA